MVEKKPETIWVTCAHCGHRSKKHTVLHEKVVLNYEDEDSPPFSETHHRLVECMGCESIKYVQSSLDLRYAEYSGESREEDFRVYPDAPGKMGDRRQPVINSDDLTDGHGDALIPEIVLKMYRETIEALNANARTLAGGGIRAIVESICLDKKIVAPDLQKRIEKMATEGLITKSQADFLHEARYLGNAAIHEMETPVSRDIDDGLSIIEGMITAIYVWPSRAKGMKDRREAKKAAKPSKQPPKGDKK